MKLNLYDFKDKSEVNLFDYYQNNFTINFDQCFITNYELYMNVNYYDYIRDEINKVYFMEWYEFDLLIIYFVKEKYQKIVTKVII